jgi:Icc protein
MPAGMPFMDTTWPFHRSHDLLPIFTRHPAPVHIFCGHYHVEKTIHHLNLNVSITPSCYFQLDSQNPNPAFGHTDIALRVIDISERQIVTSLHQWPGDKASKFF